jgi:hypothetical protein
MKTDSGEDKTDRVLFWAKKITSDLAYAAPEAQLSKACQVLSIAMTEAYEQGRLEGRLEGATRCPEACVAWRNATAKKATSKKATGRTRG